MALDEKKNPDSLKDFTQRLKDEFDQRAEAIKKDSKDYTPQARAVFLEFPYHLAACLTEIEAVEAEQPDMSELDQMDLPPEQIAQILAQKKKNRLEKIAKTIFTIACASEMDMKACLAFAEEHGVNDLTSFDPNTGLSPLVAAMLRREDPKHIVAAMKALEDAGANINAISPDGSNIAHMAALFGVHNDVLDHLIDRGVDFNLVNKKGDRPLDVAAKYRDAEFMKAMMEKAGAKFKSTSLARQNEIEDEISKMVEGVGRVKSAAQKRKSKEGEPDDEEEAKAEVEKTKIAEKARLEQLEKERLDIEKKEELAKKNADLLANFSEADQAFGGGLTRVGGSGVGAAGQLGAGITDDNKMTAGSEAANIKLSDQGRMAREALDRLEKGRKGNGAEAGNDDFSGVLNVVGRLLSDVSAVAAVLKDVAAVGVAGASAIASATKDLVSDFGNSGNAADAVDDKNSQKSHVLEQPRAEKEGGRVVGKNTDLKERDPKDHKHSPSASEGPFKSSGGSWAASVKKNEAQSDLKPSPSSKTGNESFTQYVQSGKNNLVEGGSPSRSPGSR